jgi:hypothetical protein
MERVCPNMTFLQYKKVYNATVTTETKGEDDYYGGHVEYACYVCDIPKLYEMLKEMGVVAAE